MGIDSGGRPEQHEHSWNARMDCQRTGNDDGRIRVTWKRVTSVSDISNASFKIQ